MANEIAKIDAKAVAKFGMDIGIPLTESEIGVVNNAIASDLNTDELKLFIHECKRRGVHPLDKQIFPIKRAGKVSFQTGIDYLRSESESAGDYDGMDEPVFGPDLGTADMKYPEWAKVTVYRLVNGRRIAFTGTTRWKELCPPPSNDFMWKKMPYHMLSKTAEAMARRLAWPKKLGGLYVPEELDKTRAEDAGVMELTVEESVEAAAPVPEPEVAEPGVKEQLSKLLSRYSKDDKDIFMKTLKEISLHGKKYITDINTATEADCAEALGNLKRRMNRESNLPEDCTRRAENCDHSSFVSEGEATRTLCGDKHCKFPPANLFK